jgi:hypothetical protein
LSEKNKPTATMDFINQLWDLFEQDIVIDFTTIEFAEPWSILILAESLKRFTEIRLDADMALPFASKNPIERS